MHDTIRKAGPKRVLWEKIFLSGRFQEIAIIDNITAVRKVKKDSSAAMIYTELRHTRSARALHRRPQKQRAELENRRSKLIETVDASDLATTAALHDLLKHRPIMKITPFGAIFFSFVADQRIPAKSQNRPNHVRRYRG
jgi:hypothetical protein